MIVGFLGLAIVDSAWADLAQSTIDEWAKEANTTGWRAGRGMTICPIKISILMIVYFAWVATCSWINNDAERLGDPLRGKWNGTNIIAFCVGMLATLFIPIFWVGLPVLILAWLIPTFRYISYRNKDMLDADKVMTAGHLAFWFRTRVLKQKVHPKKMSYEGGSMIQLEAAGDISEREALKRIVEARLFNGSVGYNNLRELLYHALHARATDVVINFGVEETTFQYQIDGVYQPIADAFKQPWTRQEADEVSMVTKAIIGGNPDDRRSRYTGLMKLLYDRNKKGKPLTCDARVETAGTKTGEIIKITFLFKTASFSHLYELGVSEDREKQMKRLINADNGLVVLSTSPHHGLKTLTTVIFNSADRFTRDFAGVEDEQHPYEVIENITITHYDSAKGQTPMDVLPDVFFREPKVLLIRDMVNLESWKLCCEEVKNDRLIITTLRAPDGVGTIVELLKMGVDAKLLAESLTAVISQRLVRRLCLDCKEETQAPKQMIGALGLDPSNPVIYRKRVHEPVEPGQKDYYVPCEECRDIGYKGRVAIFDTLEINDEMRQIIAADAPLDKKSVALRHAAQKSGQNGFMTDGFRLIRAGITSIEEVQRALQNK